ncbi:MAG TPA: Gfo/Idh/MocA family oxidoreductase [Streptosporangiaceae bacterium]|nr:Gfo/Idh/MocA family oxidoreductase [Streptosporangiaceae bacterium]
MTAPLRFGLVGTGYWARITHAPALASTNGVEFAAVWGRNREAAAGLAAQYRVAAYDDISAFLSAVDAVAFAVPPDVQAAIAVRAARAGKHLLLEKPIAASDEAASALVEAVGQAGVASVVFFTHRFQPDVRDWLAGVDRGGWSGGVSVWLGSALQESSPFNTPWRNDKGALWDLAPHVVSLLWAALGPVASVTADAGPADVTHLVLHHEGGATSTATLTLSAPEGLPGLDLYVWGTGGTSCAPTRTAEPVVQLRTALAELAEDARSGRTGHPCDVRFGQAVGQVIAEAERQIAGARSRTAAQAGVATGSVSGTAPST